LGHFYPRFRSAAFTAPKFLSLPAPWNRPQPAAKLRVWLFGPNCPDSDLATLLALPEGVNIRLSNGNELFRSMVNYGKTDT
jgi:hypothetical protein